MLTLHADETASKKSSNYDCIYVKRMTIDKIGYISHHNQGKYWMQMGHSKQNTVNNLQVKDDFALAHRILAHEEMHEGTWTHLSVVVPENRTQLFVTPGDRHFADIYQDDVLTMNHRGEVVSGAAAPNSAAWCLHFPIHQARDDAECVVHLHSTYSVALMMQKAKRLNERANQLAATLYGQIAYYDVYDGLLKDTAEGEAMARVLGDKNILVLRNHGFIVVADTIGRAIERAYLFERACKLQLLAESSLQELSVIPQSIIDAVCHEENTSLGSYFDGMKVFFQRERT